MRSLFLALILSTAAIGCASKHAPESEAPSQHASGDQPASDQHRADDKATDDLQAHRAEEAKATDQKASADADAVKAHAVVDDQLQAGFDESDRRFNALKENTSKLTGAKKKNANAAVTAVKTREATAMASIAKLRDASLQQWDADKAHVDSDLDAFNKSIDALEKTMQ